MILISLVAFGKVSPGSSRISLEQKRKRARATAILPLPGRPSFLIDELLEVKLQTAADQVLTDIGICELITRICVIEKLVFGEDAPLR